MEFLDKYRAVPIAFIAVVVILGAWYIPGVTYEWLHPHQLTAAESFAGAFDGMSTTTKPDPDEWLFKAMWPDSPRFR